MVLDNSILVDATSNAPINPMSIQGYIAERVSYEKHQHKIKNSR